MAILFRADATPQIGSGHVMRSLALAQAFSRRGVASTFLHAASELLRTRLSSNEVGTDELLAVPGSTADAEATIEAAQRIGAKWVVADGYDFGAAFQATLQSAGLRVLRLDDVGDADGYPAEVVLNQNPSASALMYESGIVSRRLLLGPKYALIREEFRRYMGWRRPVHDTVTRGLVTLGGNPQPEMLRSVVTEARAAIDTVTVFPGQVAASDFGLLEGISGVQVCGPMTSMVESMVESDVAVSAAGSTSLELLFLGLPGVLIDLAPNQTPNAVWLAEHEVAMRIAGCDAIPEGAVAEAVSELAVDAARRAAMSVAGSALVDGNGADRVVEELALIAPLQ